MPEDFKQVKFAFKYEYTMQYHGMYSIKQLINSL